MAAAGRTFAFHARPFLLQSVDGRHLREYKLTVAVVWQPVEGAR